MAPPPADPHAAEDDFPPGEVIPGTPYRVLSNLGEGGHGVILAVEHVRTNARFAIKILRKRYSLDPEYVSRLRHESRFIETIGPHPKIVVVVDAGFTLDKRCFQVMELLEGRTLRELIVINKFLSVRRSCEIILDVADALSAAHACRIVHRDVKPTNVFVTYDGTAKLLDFGVSKAMFHVSGKPSTLKGMLPGTPAYMAPEYIEHQRVTPSIDQYAAGVVLWECITGQPPFSSSPDDAHETMRTVVYRGLPSLEEMGFGKLPAPLLAAVRRATAKSPAARYPSIDDFARDLKAALVFLEEAPRRGRASLPSLPPGADVAPGPAASAHVNGAVASERGEAEPIPKTVPEGKGRQARPQALDATPGGPKQDAHQSPGVAADVDSTPEPEAARTTWLPPEAPVGSPEFPITSINPALMTYLARIDPLGPTDVVEAPAPGSTRLSAARSPDLGGSAPPGEVESVEHDLAFDARGELDDGPTQKVTSPFFDQDDEDVAAEPDSEANRDVQASADPREVAQHAGEATATSNAGSGRAAAHQPSTEVSGGLDEAAGRRGPAASAARVSPYDLVDYEVTDESLLFAEPGFRLGSALALTPPALDSVVATAGRETASGLARASEPPPDSGSHEPRAEPAPVTPPPSTSFSEDEGPMPSSPISVRMLPADSIRERPRVAMRDAPTLMETRPELASDAPVAEPATPAVVTARRSRPSPVEVLRHAYRTRPASVLLGAAVFSFAAGSALVGSLVYAALRPSAPTGGAPAAMTSAALRPWAEAPPATSGPLPSPSSSGPAPAAPASSPTHERK